MDLEILTRHYEKKHDLFFDNDYMDDKLLSDWVHEAKKWDASGLVYASSSEHESIEVYSGPEQIDSDFDSDSEQQQLYTLPAVREKSSDSSSDSSSSKYSNGNKKSKHKRELNKLNQWAELLLPLYFQQFLFQHEHLWHHYNSP